MESNAAVTGEENIYFEMESKREADSYDEVVQTLPTVLKRTNCETCIQEVNNGRHALAELENVCRSNRLIIRRMWFILAATVALLLTAVATLVLLIMTILSTSSALPANCAVTAGAKGKVYNLHFHCSCWPVTRGACVTISRHRSNV